ncbi:hypothetical protein AMTR_s00067p00091510 [Amborella trichopoda]|uniref:F-box protein n=1 Tax=Amborella trichopoda TaxID=13333 RepID=U5DEH0_AMBTC|nr:hypothetical protein AMTR_s00067p00091510 [Amborella trichopoda]
MAQVLAINKAYPLSLLPGMLEKFPYEMKPTMWWPKRAAATPSKTEEETTDNGWSTEMAEVAGVVRERDTAEYMRLSKLVLNCNMAVAGPILMATATVGSALGGSTTVGGIVVGALACVVNSFSHGGQVWMVFDMFRNNSGFYQLLDKSLSSSLDKPLAQREHVELVETRLALKLGRSISSLRLLPLLKETSSAHVLDKFSNNPFDDDAHFKETLSVMDKKTMKPFHAQKLKQ